MGNLRGAKRFVTCAILVGCGISLAGCGGGGGSRKGKIVVYQYPEFYQPDLKTIAVLPFRDPPQAPGVGARISDQIAMLLTKNGTYEVYTRTHLADVLAERDLADAGIIDADQAMQIGQAKSVQALVCGICARYETATKNETRFMPVPVFGRDARGKQVITGFEQKPYPWTRHDAFVECNVVIIDAKTGRHIGAVNEPTNVSDSGSPPHKGPPELLAMAEEEQVVRITRGLAVTRSEIKLKGDVLKTAGDFYDGKWEWKDRFRPSDD
ncbi:MAG TPA: CsgG/HfaB family protein, partial [Phycisphaerae bacterium]|nr:CsgG/HfaB family protein [Phycisphaerae bacterium]